MQYKWIKVFLGSCFILLIGGGIAYAQTTTLNVAPIYKGYFTRVVLPDTIPLTFNQKRTINKAITDSAYGLAAQLLLKYVEEDGYPFAKIEPQIIATSSGFDLGLKVTKGPIFIWDTLTLPPNIPVKGKFLEKFLYLKRGQIYNPKQAASVATILKSLPYLQLQTPIIFAFEGRKASPQLQVKFRKVNTADGVLGFLPNERQQGKLILNGEVNLKLVNLFKTGKSIDLQWRSTRPGSLKLLAEYCHPVFLGTHWELQANLQLLKEDSSFFNRAMKGTFLYQFENGAKAGIYYRDSRSSVLLQNQISSTQQAVNLSSTRFNEIGAAIEINTLSDYFSPRKGIYLKSEFGYGAKQLSSNNPDSTSQNNSLGSNSPQSAIKILLSSYISLTPKSTLLLKFQLARLWNNNFQRNELLRFGGLNSFRGFAENFFFTSSYLAGTAEWFYYIEENSSVGLFAEQAIMQRYLLTKQITDYPTAFGLALKFSTRNGIFNLAYAFGRNTDTPFSVNTAVVHFGISGRF